MNPLFAPHSMYWRVNREWLIALAGPRAVLLELAHPGVAAGVAQHSNYRGDPFGRLYRTMKTMTLISFGTKEEMRGALKHFHKCHARVRGDIEPSASEHSALSSDSGTFACPHAALTYDARDPALQFWVLATLIDSVLRVYERFVEPLTLAEKTAYYDDCKQLAALMGISRAAVPPTYTEFNAYMDETLNGDTLHITSEGRAVADALFAQSLRGRLTRRFSFASIGMLPPHLRAAYGYAWDEERERKLERLAQFTRRLRPHIPHFLAVHPRALLMERHISFARS